MSFKSAAKAWPAPERNVVALTVWTKGYSPRLWRDVVAPQSRKPLDLRHETWIAERLRIAATMLRDSIDIDPEKRGSVPVIKGTRVPVATVLAELAEDANVSSIADDLGLDSAVLQGMLHGMAIHLDRPFLK